ncbi:hypothetical protein KKH13_04355 [Patescibacteria group bacterium]|nr:hypothetical protein [Patescibacteria group bacterium]
MPINDCTPASTFGPVDHTIFLGLSVLSFNASLGWGEQVSQLTVQLAEDTCTSVTGKVYWDSNLIQQTTGAADDGFLGEDRWETPSGSRYSGAQLDGADTLVSSAIELVGLPAYFRVGNFEFSGLIQSWVKEKSSSANPVYTVVLNDPRQLLEGTRLITNEYSGSVGDTYNLFNAYGYMEAFGNFCPQLYYNGTAYVLGDSGYDGATFGSAAGGFGGANVNNNGMQFSRIMTAINILCNTAPKTTNVWSPYGRIIFSGVSGGGGGLMGWDLYSLSDGYLTEYLLDISELPTPPSYWRINSDEVSILEFISQLCEDAGYDYYIELLPVRGASSAIAFSGIAKIIKIRTVARTTQPSLNALTTFIDASSGTIDNSAGKELRDETLNAFVIGGPKQVTYQAIQHYDPELDGTDVLSQLGTTIAVGANEIDDLILPYFGQYSNGDVIMPIRNAAMSGQWEFEAPTDDINAQLTFVNLTNFTETPDNRLTITELELQAAAVDYDSWLAMMEFLNSDTWQAINGNMALTANPRSIFCAKRTWQAWRDGQWPIGRDMMRTEINTFLGRVGDFGKIVDDLQHIYDWVATYANDFYAKKYQVRLPNTNVRQDSESDQTFMSEEPSDGSWTEYSSVIGLPNPSPLLNFFRLDDGRIGPFGRFQNASGTILGDGAGVEGRDLDLNGTLFSSSQLNINDYGISGNKVYVRGEIEKDFVYFDASSYLSPRVVVEFPEQTKRVDDGGQFTEETRLLYKAMDWSDQAIDVKMAAEQGMQDIGNSVGSKIVNSPLLYSIQMPEAITFGIKSNTLTYGPWVSGGKPGRVRVEVNGGLVPWEYGGMTTMNLAGQSKADEGLTNMKIGEMGRITVPGYPTVPLGAEINSSTYLLESRTLDNDIINETHAISGPFVAIYHFLNTPVAIGTNGPNVTDLNVEVGPGGIQTTYAMSTFTQRFGRFSKNNSERLKQIGQLQFKLQEKARNKDFGDFRRLLSRKLKSKRRGDIFRGIGLTTHTPHEVLAASISPSMTTGIGAGFRRSIVTLNSIKEIPNELATGYANKAFMSLDGLIRPISMDGIGGLPRYATPINACQKATSVGMHPPVLKSGTLQELYKPIIDINYLNPFSNPSGVGSRTGLMSKVPNPTGYVGHDIDIVGRGLTVPESGMIMPVAGFDGLGGADYEADYRMLGLRGPMLLQSWGYDLNGKPIPNLADNEIDASGGVFASTGLQDYFMNQWLKKSHTWPVAPVDLRFDRARGVWVSPPAHRFVTVDLKNTLNGFGSTSGTVVTGEALYDTTGLIVGGVNGLPSIMINDNIGKSISSGTRILTYYDPYSCQYHPLVEGSGSSNIEWGRVSGVLTAGGTQNVNIWKGGPATGNLTYSNINIVAGAPPLATAPISGWVLLNKINGYWWVVGARCS